MKKLFLFVMIILPAALLSQTVSGLQVSAGASGSPSTVTFNVSWNEATLPTPWLDSMWVFVDYNKNGKMTRLLISGGTLTEHTATKAGTGEFIPENDMGAWVYGDARTNTAGSFSAKVELYTKETDIIIAGACAYASSYPPVADYLSDTKLGFTGTPMYDITLTHTNGSTITVSSGGTFFLPCSYTVSSFTDRTGAPGMFNCIRPATYTLSGANVCEGGEVTLTLNGSESGWKYQLYKDNMPMAGSEVDGMGNALIFTDASAAVGGHTYAVRTVGGGATRCDMPVGMALVTVNPLPNPPTSPSSNERCGSGTVTFSANVPGGHTIDWYTAPTSGSTVSGGYGRTSFSPPINSNTTYYAQARSAAGCISVTRLAVGATMTSPPIITLSGGESYQSVDLNAPITTVTYTASSATDIYLYSGTFPTGVTGSASGLAFTVQGTPSTAGEYNYSVAAYRYGCENVFAYGQIKANAVIPQYAASANTWVVGNQTWSDVISIPDCNKTGFSVPVSSKNADCRNNPGYDGYLYSWYYVDNNASTLCTYPWRVPSVADFCTLDKTLFSTSTCSYRSGSMDYLIYNGAAWGGTFGGLADGSWGTVSGQGDRAYYWSSEIMTGNGRTLQYTSIYDTVDPGDYISATYGLQVRCVKSSSWY